MRNKMNKLDRMKALIAALVAIVATFLLAAPARAHVEINRTSVPAGKPVKVDFEIGHGCDGAATTGLVVQVPAGVEAKALPTAGWKPATRGATISWKGGPLADHDHQAFPFRATFYGEKGDEIALRAIQNCEGGASTAWIQPSSGGAEPEHPAPVVTLTSSAEEPAVAEQEAADKVAEEDAAATGEPTASAATDDSSDSDDDGDTRTVLLLVVAGLAIGTIAALIARARAQRK